MPGKLSCLAQCLDLRGDDAQILGDQRQPSEDLLDRLEQVGARPLDPFARPGGRLAGRDFPVRLEAAEVVEPDQIDQLQVACRRATHQA